MIDVNPRFWLDIQQQLADISHDEMRDFALQQIQEMPPAIFLILIGCMSAWFLLRFIKERLAETQQEDVVRRKNHFIVPSPQKVVNHRFAKIRSMFESPDEDKWRLAIIDADTMLEDMLHWKGYSGTIGEMLKSIPRNGMPMLDYAWQAHKVRNRIAHEGSSFRLSQADAWRVFKMYEAVFNANGFV